MAGLMMTGSAPKALAPAGDARTPTTKLVAPARGSLLADAESDEDASGKPRRKPPFSKKRLAFRESSSYAGRGYSGPATESGS